MIYSIDFETRSHANLPDVGLDIYANDPTTEVLCIAFGTTPDNVVVQAPTPTEDSPAYCLRWLLDHVEQGGKIQAWNAMFEYAIWNCVCVPKYGWPPLKLEQCIDTMAIAAANNVPQSLDDAGNFMNSEHKKDAVGKRLIMKLSKPSIKGVFNNDPELLKQLFDYCAQDVRTEMAIGSVLRPLSDVEQEVWTLTQRINLRGVPVDPRELQNAVLACEKAQGEIDRESLELTGCKPSERAKLLEWINQKIPHAPMPDLTAETVSKMLQCNIFPVIKRALELRQEGSQTSVAKYAKMLEIQREGRIRNTLVYHGASTGRWASRGGLNLQNIARPTLQDGEIERAIPRVFDGGLGSMSELSSLVRSAISAPPGQTFVDVDFSSIENRVGVWLAGQRDKVELFRKGLDEYKVFASESLYHVPYEEVTKDMRQVSKSAVLGALFGQGPKGLVKYAEGMGVKLSEGQAKNAVDSYRASYQKVKQLWYGCESAAIHAMRQPGDSFSPNSCFKESDENWDLTVSVPLDSIKLKMKYAKDALWMQLPSGRLICWQRPQLELVTTPWGQQKLGVTVLNQSTYTRQWSRNQIIGSSIFQSAVQGTARDCLAVAALRLDKAGFEMINFVHDEILMLVKEENAEASLTEVMSLMNIPPDWALDLPLACEGWISKRYRK
jgi:DNA polymerase bacteriophage-type